MKNNIVIILVAFFFATLFSKNSFAQNTATGTAALSSVTTGTNNSAFGYFALLSTTTGSYNTGIGSIVLENNKSGSYNVGAGSNALISNTSGYYNVGIGYSSLYTNSTGFSNVGVGYNTLYLNATSNNNTAIGFQALYSTTDSNNTALGSQALVITTGAGNTAAGYNAGAKYASYTNCTFLGNQADASASGYSNAMSLGYNALVGGNNTIRLGNTTIATIDAQVDLTITSDKRFKTNVKENVPGLAFIKELRPVTYHFDMHKMDEFIYGDKVAAYEKEMAAGIEAKGKVSYTGFLAQEVEASAKKVGYDFSGVKTPQNDKDMYGLAYSEFVVPLVKGMQEQQVIIEAQQQLLTNLMNKVEVMTVQLNDIRECCSTGNNPSGSINTTPASLETPQLFNAIPNPASGSTVIYYFVPTKYNSAKIQITDMNGQVMQTLAITNSGYASSTLQVGNLAHAVYTYSLIVDDKLVSTKTLSVVLK